MELEEKINIITKCFSEANVEDLQKMVNYYESHFDENEIYDIVKEDNTRAKITTGKYYVNNNYYYGYYYNDIKEGYEWKLQMAS